MVPASIDAGNDVVNIRAAAARRSVGVEYGNGIPELEEEREKISWIRTSHVLNGARREFRDHDGMLGAKQFAHPVERVGLIALDIHLEQIDTLIA